MALYSSSSSFTLRKPLQPSNENFSSRPSQSNFSKRLLLSLSNPNTKTTHILIEAASPRKWRTRVSSFPNFLPKGKDIGSLKEELLEAIAPLGRGAEASPEDQQRVDQVCEIWPGISPSEVRHINFFGSGISSNSWRANSRRLMQ